ncbi:MAG: hypothetical protein ACYC8V_01760 [Caulobacteraceae bacterium]
MFAALPLLALPVIAYNLFALSLSGGLRGIEAPARLAAPLFRLRTAAGGVWPVSVSDLILAASLVVLFIELLKTTSRRAAVINHSLSMLLFVACLVELLLAPAFANSTFFLITLMVLLDVLAGFIVTIAASRREFDEFEDR